MILLVLLQHMLRFKKNVSLIIFLCGFVCGILLISLCGSIIFHLLENFKDEDDIPSETQGQKVPEEQGERVKQD